MTSRSYGSRKTSVVRVRNSFSESASDFFIEKPSSDVTIHDRWRVRSVSFEWISPRAAFQPFAIRSTQNVLPRPSVP